MGSNLWGDCFDQFKKNGYPLDLDWRRLPGIVLEVVGLKFFANFFYRLFLRAFH
jgi:hypothetical protein